MRKFYQYFSWAVVLLYFALGIFVLVSPRMQHLPRQVRIIFAIFLFLYGGYRVARLWTRLRESDDPSEE